MTDTVPRLTVIIVNWNTGELLRKCLASVRAAVLQEATEVIVVDNASTDGSECMVETEFPEFRLRRSRDNIGFARANNLAASEARGERLLFLNPDTTVRPDTLRVLLELADSYAHPTIIGCRVRLADGRVQDDAGGYFFTPGRALLSRLHAERLLPNQAVNQSARLSATTPVDWVSGVCLLIERRAFNGLGGFDAGMFAYLEDMDLCRRARERGIHSFFTVATEITHFKGASFAGRPFRQAFCSLQSQIIFVRRHWPALAGAAYLLELRLHFGLLILWSGMLGRQHRQQEARELMSLVTDGDHRSGHRSNS